MCEREGREGRGHVRGGGRGQMISLKLTQTTKEWLYHHSGFQGCDVC